MRLTSIKRFSIDYISGSESYENLHIKGLTKAIGNDTTNLTFLHNTKNEDDALKIMRDGFEFQSHIDYTTDVVSPKDPVTIKYFTIVRQAYGNFTIVIQIAKNIIEDYSNQLDNISHHFSEILSIKPPYIGPEDDLIYCLAPHFVKGYINATTGKVYYNADFNPTLKIRIFDKNLKAILNNKE